MHACACQARIRYMSARSFQVRSAPRVLGQRDAGTAPPTGKGILLSPVVFAGACRLTMAGPRPAAQKYNEGQVTSPHGHLSPRFSSANAAPGECLAVTLRSPSACYSSRHHPPPRRDPVPPRRPPPPHTPTPTPPLPPMPRPQAPITDSPSSRFRVAQPKAPIPRSAPPLLQTSSLHSRPGFLAVRPSRVLSFSRQGRYGKGGAKSELGPIDQKSGWERPL